MSEFTLKTPTQEPDLSTAMQVVYQWNYDPDRRRAAEPLRQGG